MAITVLLDCHSGFQIALGSCTWGIDYRVRPQALTAVILCLSIACNITAGILITVGDRRTRKKHVVEQMKRQDMTHHAMKKVIKRREDPWGERERCCDSQGQPWWRWQFYECQQKERVLIAGSWRAASDLSHERTVLGRALLS